MTRVTLKKDENRYSVICEGHAVGSCEVCAAVSTLVYTLLGYLKNADDVAVEKSELADGYAEIEFSGSECARMAFEFVAVGFLQLERSAAKYIEVCASEK